MFNPYQTITPMMNIPNTAASTGLIKTGINWATILSNTQKTLNIVNQAIPIVYQVKPIINNAKTMFKVANEFNKTNASINNDITYKDNTINNDGPKFFI